jgi:hypothetical protein
MKSPILAVAVAVPLLALPALAATAPRATPKAVPRAAVAATTFDGNWSVLIVTDKGTCDKAYRYPLVIREGAVLYGGKSGFAVDGSVDPKGVVRVRISYSGQSANGTGRLALKSGSGSWVAGNNACSGRWRAERRA